MSLPAGTLARVFWRSLFVQAAWNRRGMQNLGFAWAMDPALRAIYGEGPRRDEALRRHLGFFNCHPYMAAAIVGGAIHHEEKVAAGQESAASPLMYKQTLQGPLAAVGDGFFWTALRPFFGALAAVAALAFGAWGVVAALAAYNAIHLWLRAGLFRAGYRHGDQIVGVVAGLGLPALADRLRHGTAALCGVAGAILVLRASLGSGSGAGMLAALATVGGYLALARGAGLLPTAYGAALAAAALVLALHIDVNGSP